MPLQLWWKTKDLSRLHPVKKLVHRHGVTFYQTFWVADKPPQGQPHEFTPEAIDKLIDDAKVLQWYDALTERFEREVGRSDWKDPAWNLGRESWERLVDEAHKSLKKIYGSDRLVIVTSPTQVLPANLIVNQGLFGLPHFNMLVHQVESEVARKLLDALEMPYPCWQAVCYHLGGLGYAFNGNLVRALKDNPEMSKPIFPDELPFFLYRVTVPQAVIDPNSKQEIQIDDYLKRWLPALEEVLGTTLQGKLLKEIDGVLDAAPPTANIKDTLSPFYKPEKFSPALRPNDDAPRRVLQWIEQYPEVFKTLFTFFVHTGDRDVALLGFHAAVKTMHEVAKRCHDGSYPPSSATKALAQIQEIFERHLEDSKKVLGMEKFPIPPQRIWETFWAALKQLEELKETEVQVEIPPAGDAVPLRWLLNYSKWDLDSWNSTMTKAFKRAIDALWGEDVARTITEDTINDIFRSGSYLKNTVSGLIWFSRVIKGLGDRFIKEQRLQLEEKAKTLKREVSQSGLHTQLAQKAVRKFHNNLSSIAKNVQKLKVGDLTPSAHYLAVVDFSPQGFYSLTLDGTCFSNSNRSHPFILSGTRNSFVVRFFAPMVGYLGRMWGIIDPDNRTAYFTNRYGDININGCKNLARYIAAALLGTKPNELTIEDDSESKKIAGVLRRRKLRPISERPYLNKDTFIVSAGRREL
jgi:hypothetical protein